MNANVQTTPSVAVAVAAPSVAVAAVAAPARGEVRVAVAAAAPDGAQDCSTCAVVRSCWRTARRDAAVEATPAEGKGISPSNVVSNLLVCRIKRGIRREASTKLLLGLLKPKLRKTAGWVRAKTGMAFDDVLMDLQSVAIETLLTSYTMGERAPPLVWLFHPQHGAIRNWAVRTVDRVYRDHARLVSYGCISDDETARDDDFSARIYRLNVAVTSGRIHSPPPMPTGEMLDHEAEVLWEERVRHALAAVDDGAQLSTVEYRVLRFCLTNAHDNDRATESLHQHLSSVMGIPRKDVSRIYGIARRKLIEAVGLRVAYLAARGIRPPKARQDKTRPLTADEVLNALEILQASAGRATILDVAWALGVTDVTLHKIRRRFGSMAAEEVRAKVQPARKPRL